MTTIVTAANIDIAREQLPALDQRAELEIGCETWTFDGGCMTIWPNGRGAVCWNGNSLWGDWNASLRTLSLDAGGEVNDTGEFACDCCE